MGIFEGLRKISIAVKKKRKYFTVPQYAHFVQIPEDYVSKFLKSDTLHSVKIDGESLIPKTVGMDQRNKVLKAYMKSIGVKKLDRSEGGNTQGFLHKVGSEMTKRIKNSPIVTGNYSGQSGNRRPQPSSPKRNKQSPTKFGQLDYGVSKADGRPASLLPNLKNNIFLQEDE